MKKYSSMFLLASMALSLTGCFAEKNDVEALTVQVEKLEKYVAMLQNNLGEYQYLSLDPELRFNVSGVEFLKPDSQYGSPDVKYRINIKQLNSSFPISSYSIAVKLSVLDQNNNSVDSFFINDRVEDGVLSIADEHGLYGVKRRDFSGCKLVVSEYNWFPNSTLKPAVESD